MLYSSTHAPIYLYETFAQANAKLSTQYLSLFFLLLCKRRGLLLSMLDGYCKGGI